MVILMDKWIYSLLVPLTQERMTTGYFFLTDQNNVNEKHKNSVLRVFVLLCFIKDPIS